MNKQEIENLKVLQNIFKNANNKIHQCLICSQPAINSHLLQKNGILNKISSNNHIVQIQSNDIFQINEKGLIKVSTIGLNNAMSYPLFCNYHDTELFKEIETEIINFEEYNTHLLFSYRSLCAELRKKLINIDVFKRINKSKTFSGYNQLHDNLNLQIEANEIGISDLRWYKNEFEKNFINNNLKNFEFEFLEFDFLPICTSAVYSPIIPQIHTIKYIKDKSNIFDYIFFNIIPYDNKLKVIIGNHKNKVNEWIKDYIITWKNINSQKELTLQLTDLFSTKIETWAIEPTLFKSFSKENINKFKNHWNKEAQNLTINQKVDFNLFE